MKYTIIIAVVTLILTHLIAYKLYKNKLRSNIVSELNIMLTKIISESFSSESISTTSNRIISILVDYYRVDYVTLLMLNSGGKLRVLSSNVKEEYVDKIEKHCNKQIRDMENSVVKLRVSDEVTLNGELEQIRGIKWSLFTPLYFKQQLIGAILIESLDKNKIEKEKMRSDIHDKVFKSTALVLQNMIHTEKLRIDVSIDKLTGVYNRRFIDSTLKDEIINHDKINKTFSIAMMDIDNFKRFNDKYGHPFGDFTLKFVSRYIQKKLGANDWIARYGGEEFIIFFKDSKSEEAYKKVDNIREEISKLVITDGEVKSKVTISFGIATFPTNGVTPEKLIEKADDALYESKESGRNKVTIAK